MGNSICWYFLVQCTQLFSPFSQPKTSHQSSKLHPDPDCAVLCRYPMWRPFPPRTLRKLCGRNPGSPNKTIVGRSLMLAVLLRCSTLAQKPTEYLTYEFKISINSPCLTCFNCHHSRSFINYFSSSKCQSTKEKKHTTKVASRQRGSVSIKDDEILKELIETELWRSGKENSNEKRSRASTRSASHSMLKFLRNLVQHN